MSSDLIFPWIRLVRQTDEISVVYVDLTPDGTREQRTLSWLDRNELQRRERIRIHRSQREFTLCRVALRRLLCQKLGCENSQLSIATAKHGKPYALVNREPVSIRFSVSHSDPHGLITIAQGVRVGVDVESGVCERDFDGISKRIFGPNERAEIASANGADKAHLFFRFWTLKEALVKALGTGLTTRLTEFEISPDLRNGAPKGIVQFPGIPDTHWLLENLSTQDYIAAVASEMRSSASSQDF